MAAEDGHAAKKLKAAPYTHTREVCMRVLAGASGSSQAEREGRKREISRSPRRLSRPVRRGPSQSFLDVYSKLRDELINDSSLGKPPPHAVEWFSEVRL